jgi:hypothetical protein
LFSLILPFIHIEGTGIPVSLDQAINEPFTKTAFIGNEIITNSSTENEITSHHILIFLYCCVAMILLARYLYNIWNLHQLYQHSELIIYKGRRISLINKNLGPFTFMNAIFINKASWKQGAVDDSLILHEIAHLNQKHTLDLLFIELVKIFLWFNPLVYLFKDLIQKNHEYLADNEVITSGVKAGDYAENIIDFTSKPARYAIVSAFNIKYIENRIIMLTKTTPKRSLQITLLSTIIFVTLFSTMAFELQSERFRRNPTDQINLETYSYKTRNLGGFTVNGDTTELFVWSQERGYIYLFSKKYSSSMYSSNTRDTAYYRLAKYELKEFDGQLFINDEFIGTVQKGDYIIVRGDPLIEVYDKTKVTSENLQRIYSDQLKKMRKN